MVLNLKKIIYYLFIITFFFLSFTDAFFVSKGVNSFIDDIKYLFLIVLLLVCILYIRINNKRIDNKYFILIKYIGIFIVLVAIMSFISSFIVGKFTTNSMGEIIILLLSVLSAYLILSTLEPEKIYYAMFITLIFSFIFYILSIGISEFFEIQNYLEISFINSYSIFESHYFCGISYAMFLYFYLNSRKKFPLILSFIYTFLTFKRIFVITSILLLIFYPIVKKKKSISFNTRVCFSFIFFVSTISYYLLLIHGDNFIYSLTGEKLYELTMSRNIFLDKLINLNYVSYGFGSSTNFLGRSIEMDLIKIYIELGGIMLLFLCLYYSK